jgi:hypothetical protein
MEMLFFSDSYHSFTNGAVCNQLTDVVMRGRLYWVTVNLLMCEEEGVEYYTLYMP